MAPPEVLLPTLNHPASKRNNVSDGLELTEADEALHRDEVDSRDKSK